VPINSAGGNFAGGFIGGTSLAPIMFYSRRIGLYGDHEVPLNIGGRLTGRAGKYSVGVLNIQTGDKSEFGAPATNFSVVRVKRDVLRRSSIGLLFTNRSESTLGPGASRAYGIDGTFAFYENLQINTYWSGTATDALSSRDSTSYRGQLDYSGDRYTVQLERLKVGDNFNPEVGFLRRDNMVRDYARFKFSPRPRNRSAIRKYVYDASIDYIENTDGVLESRERSRSICHVAMTEPSCKTVPCTIRAVDTGARSSPGRKRLRSACDSNRLSYSGKKREGAGVSGSGRGASGRSNNSRPRSSRNVRSRWRSRSSTSRRPVNPAHAATSATDAGPNARR